MRKEQAGEGESLSLLFPVAEHASAEPACNNQQERFVDPGCKKKEAA